MVTLVSVNVVRVAVVVVVDMVVVVVSVAVVSVAEVVVVADVVVVAVVAEEVVRDVVVLVVVVHPRVYEASVPSPQGEHVWSEVAVASILTYSPCRHTVSGVHSRSVSPAAGAFDSHSESAQLSDVLHTTLDVVVAAARTNSLLPHLLCRRHSVSECTSAAWYVSRGHSAHVFSVASRYCPALHSRSVVVVVVVVVVEVAVNVVRVTVVAVAVVLVPVNVVVVLVAVMVDVGFGVVVGCCPVGVGATWVFAPSGGTLLIESMSCPSHLPNTIYNRGCAFVGRR